ncbi:hypothetical protein [Candidatus Galacturonibacter soehngenii]|nr:hypothetical protein [Candidatus Galacturonibacter soehngenii]
MNKIYELIIGALISKLICFLWDKVDKQIEKKINDRLSRKVNGR